MLQGCNREVQLLGSLSSPWHGPSRTNSGTHGGPTGHGEAGGRPSTACLRSGPGEDSSRYGPESEEPIATLRGYRHRSHGAARLPRRRLPAPPWPGGGRGQAGAARAPQGSEPARPARCPAVRPGLLPPGPGRAHGGAGPGALQHRARLSSPARRGPSAPHPSPRSGPVPRRGASATLTARLRPRPHRKRAQAPPSAVCAPPHPPRATPSSGHAPHRSHPLRPFQPCLVWEHPDTAHTSPAVPLLRSAVPSTRVWPGQNPSAPRRVLWPLWVVPGSHSPAHRAPRPSHAALQPLGGQAHARGSGRGKQDHGSLFNQRDQ